MLYVNWADKPFLPCSILIVDWDIHHGNGTQRVFYNNSRYVDGILDCSVL